MVKIRNVKAPEGVNVSRHSPWLDMAMLLVGLLAGITVLMALLLWFGGSLARLTPLSWEYALSGLVLGEAEAVDPDDREIPAALQTLADRLATVMIDRPDQRIVVHYVDDETVNAMATLGGNIFIFRGLLERVESENALAMVMAHEIGHVVNRDPAAMMGGAMLAQAALMLIGGSGANDLAFLFEGPTSLLVRGHGRDAERAADELALQGLVELYGHVDGAADLFRVFLEIDGDADNHGPAVLLTHPHTRDRITGIDASATDRGWPQTGDLTPLPADLTIGDD